ncbi:prominin-like protein [Drosophila obscura]|uniref:prominin-like protein n=1 Tax=Drosophila obscura TaxID=7282 RepID=UPI001BB23EDB|nr:prominin-like protein [Drosophila obscura]
MTSRGTTTGDRGGCHCAGERKFTCVKPCKRHLALLSLVIMSFVVATDGQTGNSSSMGIAADHWRTGYEGHGTTHEQVGQVHFPPVIYTRFDGFFNYSHDLSSDTKAVNPIYNFTHFIFDAVLTDEPALPPGYIGVMKERHLVLGRNVERNEWSLLLSRYWLVLFFVIFLLAAIIAVPFVAVCYCCFCCCLRCKQGCIQCMAATDRRRRLCCGVCLLVLIIGMIVGLAIAFVTNKFLDRGLEESMVTMRRSNEDTCTFLRNVADHIHHLLVFNFQELETHLIEQINEAHNHIFLDLADTSDGNALMELERILDNMPAALTIMKQLNYLEKELRFYTSNLRDSIRGLKRDMTYTVTHFCGNTKERCHESMIVNSILYMDTSTCLHLDQLPNTTVYVEAIEMIIRKKYNLIPKRALVRFNAVREKIKEQMTHVGPPLKRYIAAGHSTFDDHALRMRTLIEAMISDIHLNTLRSAKTFDDVYEKFGADRRAINIICITLLVIIIIILLTSLACGVCGYSRTHPGPSGFGSKGMAASCLLIAIIMIFCIFSFIALIGLFYFMIGLVTYEGACAPTTQQEKNELFRQVDAVIDMNRYLKPETEGDRFVMPALHMSEAVRSCQANESVFQLLRANNMYDVNDLASVKLLPDDPESAPVFTDDLSKLDLLTESEKLELNEVRNCNLTSYHSMLYDENLCLRLMNVDLLFLANDLLEEWATNPSVLKEDGRVFSFLHKYSALAYHSKFFLPVQRGMKKALKIVKDIDKLILYLNHDFGNSIQILLTSIINAENFIKKRGAEFINNLAQNLTSAINEQLYEYLDMVITEANYNVGLCQPLAYIYYEGVYFVCARLVDPINGFWLGILLCALLLLPTLFVCHRLMCLYLKIYPAPMVAAAGAPVGGCPICTGAPYVPHVPPRCGLEHDADCQCAPCKVKGKGFKKGKRGRSKGGDAPVETVPPMHHRGPVAEMTVVSEASEPSKHKRD